MPFDPTASATAPTDLGSLTDPQLASIYGLDSKTAALPIRLQKGAPANFMGPVAQRENVQRYDETLGQLGSMTSDEVEQLQRKLYAGGYFSKSYYGKTSPGVDLGNPDDPGTVHAFRQALNAAVRAHDSGDTLDDVISQSIASRQKNGLKTSLSDSGAPPLTVQLTNPADLAAAAQTAAQKKFGRAASQKEIAAFTQSFHQQEMQAQMAAHDPSQSTTVQAPNPSDYAEQFLQQTDPKAALTQNYADALGQVLGILGGKAA